MKINELRYPAERKKPFAEPADQRVGKNENRGRYPDHAWDLKSIKVIKTPVGTIPKRSVKWLEYLDRASKDYKGCLINELKFQTLQF